MAITQQNVLDALKRMMEIEITYEPGSRGESAFLLAKTSPRYPYTMAYDFFRDNDNGQTSRSDMSCLFRELFGEGHEVEAKIVADFSIGMALIRGCNMSVVKFFPTNGGPYTDRIGQAGAYGESPAYLFPSMATLLRLLHEVIPEAKAIYEEQCFIKIELKDTNKRIAIGTFNRGQA